MSAAKGRRAPSLFVEMRYHGWWEPWRRWRKRISLRFSGICLEQGFPRIITQKCGNRHGHFLLIEEFDGRRRNGTIRIPEGRFGQGWARLMVELDMANQSLGEGRGPRENKKGKEVSVRRKRFTEETGLLVHSEKECIQPGGELIARREGGNPVSYAQVVKLGGQEKTSSQDHPVPNVLLAGSKQLKGSMQGEAAALVEVAPAMVSQAKHSVLEELPKRQVSAVSLTTINDRQELCNLRDWLEQLRGEVVAGIGRLDEVIRNLNLTDSGQRRRAMGRVFHSKSLYKPKTDVLGWQEEVGS
jgi:hypothetical protein